MAEGCVSYGDKGTAVEGPPQVKPVAREVGAKLCAKDFVCTISLKVTASMS